MGKYQAMNSDPFGNISKFNEFSSRFPLHKEGQVVLLFHECSQEKLTQVLQNGFECSKDDPRQPLSIPFSTQIRPGWAKRKSCIFLAAVCPSPVFMNFPLDKPFGSNQSNSSSPFLSFGFSSPSLTLPLLLFS